MSTLERAIASSRIDATLFGRQFTILDLAFPISTTWVNRLKAAPPHFVAHVKALAPKIIMRRLATSERTVTPAPGISTPDQKFTYGDPALRHYATPPAPLGERSRTRASTLPGC